MYVVDDIIEKLIALSPYASWAKYYQRINTDKELTLDVHLYLAPQNTDEKM
jgi:hypothetical protein